MEGTVERNIKATIHKIVAWLSGETNERINEWVNDDEESFQQIIKFMDICATNGWMDLKESPFEFADDTAVDIAKELYDKAMKHFGGGK